MKFLDKFKKITNKKAALLLAALFAPFPGALPGAIAMLVAKDVFDKEKKAADDKKDDK